MGKKARHCCGRRGYRKVRTKNTWCLGGSHELRARTPCVCVKACLTPAYDAMRQPRGGVATQNAWACKKRMVGRILLGVKWKVQGNVNVDVRGAGDATKTGIVKCPSGSRGGVAEKKQKHITQISYQPVLRHQYRRLSPVQVAKGASRPFLGFRKAEAVAVLFSSRTHKGKQSEEKRRYCRYWCTLDLDSMSTTRHFCVPRSGSPHSVVLCS